MRLNSLILLVFLATTACDDGGDGGGGGGSPMADASLADTGGADAADSDALPPDAAAGRGELSALPNVLDLGTVAVGQRVQRDLALRNTGDGDLAITAFEGLENGFSVSRQPPLRIPAGQERVLVVEFQPAMEGRVMTTLRLVTDVPGAEPLEVPLHGAGGTPMGTLLTPVVDFGVVAPGEQTADFIRVQNTSESIPLTIFAVNGLEAPFGIPQGQLPATGDAGMNAEVLVQFSPMEDGDFTQEVVVATDAGDFMVTVRGRALSPGELTVRGVEPAWAPTDEAVEVVVHGGPFAGAPTAIRIGDVALEAIERIDASRLRGRLPAGGAATGTDADLQDVRVEIGPSFGVATAAFVRTGPVAAGQALDDAALATGTVGPAGNPWRLAVDAIPAGTELSVATGTVILGDERTLQVDGVLRTGGTPGVVVFSAEGRQAGAWGGLRFGASMATSNLNDTVVEYAGAGGTPAITTAQAAGFTNLILRQSAGAGIEVLAGGTLVFLGGQVTDTAGDAIQLLAPDGGWFRLTNTWMRRVQWPIATLPHHFDRPAGPGHDWADSAHDAIGLGGPVDGAATIGNQPAPLRYRVRTPIEVGENGRLGFAPAAPLVLDGPIRVAGRLELPGGLRVQAEAGGSVEIQAGAALAATGTPAMPVTFEARAPEGAARPGTWTGIHVGGNSVVEVTRLIVRDAGLGGEPAVRFEVGGDPIAINGLTVEGSAGPGLHLSRSAEIDNLALAGNAGGLLISAGEGRLAGITEDADPAVRFVEGADCGAWDLSALLDADGMPAGPACP